MAPVPSVSHYSYQQFFQMLTICGSSSQVPALRLYDTGVPVSKITKTQGCMSCLYHIISLHGICLRHLTPDSTFLISSNKACISDVVFVPFGFGLQEQQVEAKMSSVKPSKRRKR